MCAEEDGQSATAPSLPINSRGTSELSSVMVAHWARGDLGSHSLILGPAPFPRPVNVSARKPQLARKEWAGRSSGALIQGCRAPSVPKEKKKNPKSCKSELALRPQLHAAFSARSSRGRTQGGCSTGFSRGGRRAARPLRRTLGVGEAEGEGWAAGLVSASCGLGWAGAGRLGSPPSPSPAPPPLLHPLLLLLLVPLRLLPASRERPPHGSPAGLRAWAQRARRGAQPGDRCGARLRWLLP